MHAATGGPNVKWGGTDFKCAGHHWPPRWRRPWSSTSPPSEASLAYNVQLN